MSLAIDAVILLGAVLIIWNGARRGLIRSVMSLAGGIASFIAAYAYSPILAAYIKEKFLVESLTDNIDSTLRSIALDTNTDMYNLDRLAVDLPKPFTDILERYGFDSSFAERLRGLTDCEADVVRGFAEDIATPTADVIASVLAFIGIFVAAFIVLSLLTWFLDLVFKLPVLKSANTFFGFVFGVAEGALFAFASATLLSVLVTALGSVEPSLFGEAAVNETIICKWLLAHNPLGALVSFFV